MSVRPQQNPWLADYIVFLSYRWGSWLVACALAISLDTFATFGWLLLMTALVNLLTTLVSQSYVRAAQRNPAIMSLDILFMTLVLLPQSGGWQGPFVVHAASALVLPGLLFGWRGGIIAGLAFVPLDIGVNWASGVSPASLIESKRGLDLLLMMVAPPLFGVATPWLVMMLRQVLAHHSGARARRRFPFVEQDLKPNSGPDAVNRFMTIGRGTGSRPEAAEKFPQLAPITAVRAAEQGVEDLRRALFAPFPSPELDLPASLDLLASRFGQHTGIATRVTLLGRVRVVHYAHRMVLIRLTQEALLNVQQHAHAAAIMFTLRYDANSVALLVQDDGVGLLDGTYERPGGLHALRAMYYRLSELGGRLDVFETEGGGVTVRATMPLE